MTWHLQATTLRDYVEERSPAPVAWSVETHLVECARCREVLARLLSAEDTALLANIRTAVRLTAGPAPSRSRVATVVEGILGPWWSWLVLVVAEVVALVVVGRLPVPDESRSLGLTWLAAVSPVVPVAMVSAVYAVTDRDVTAGTTPRGGLELVLYRTVTALLLAVPAVTVGAWTSGALAVAWLLPGLGLCVGALALGSWVGVERAAAGLCSAWVLAVALTMTPHSPLVAGGAWLIHPTGVGLVWWWLTMAGAASVLLWRRDRFDMPRRLG